MQITVEHTGNSLRSMIFEEEIPDLYLTWFKSKKKQNNCQYCIFLQKVNFIKIKKFYLFQMMEQNSKYFNTGPISEEWLIQNKLYEKFFNNLNVIY